MWGAFSCCGSSSTPVTSSAAVMSSMTPKKRKRCEMRNGDSHSSTYELRSANDNHVTLDAPADDENDEHTHVNDDVTDAALQPRETSPSVSSSMRLSVEDDVTRRPVKCATSLKEKTSHSPLMSSERRPLKVTRSLPAHRRRPPLAGDTTTSIRTWRLRLSVRKARADFLRPVCLVTSPGSTHASHDFERKLTQFRSNKSASDVTSSTQSSGALLPSSIESIESDDCAAAEQADNCAGCRDRVARGKSIVSSSCRREPHGPVLCAASDHFKSVSRVSGVTSVPAVSTCAQLKVCVWLLCVSFGSILSNYSCRCSLVFVPATSSKHHLSCVSCSNLNFPNVAPH